jgi:hypothetical protein
VTERTRVITRTGALMNAQLSLLVVNYDGGKFAHFVDQPDWRRLFRQYGDPLFVFLMIELSSDEACDCDTEALERLKTMAAGIDQVIVRFERHVGKVRR